MDVLDIWKTNLVFCNPLSFPDQIKMETDWIFALTVFINSLMISVNILADICVSVC